MISSERGISTREKIMNAIKEHIEVKGYSPSMREISELVGLKSTSTVFGHLDRLERDGYITRQNDQPRTIRILKDI